MHLPILDFIVVGMPRSGTTWISNWLTTDRTFCMHDPFAQGLPRDWERDQRKFGISCTLSHALNGWLDEFHCPVAIIERTATDRNDSLVKAGLTAMPEHPNFGKVKGRRFAFDDLWDEEKAEAFWSYLLPAEPFDALRYRQLVRMQVQPHPVHWTMRLGVVRELIRIGYLAR